MIASHIHDALAQVRRLRSLILEKRFFTGYSGRARIISGSVAFAGAVILSSSFVPATNEAHLIGWGLVLAFALLLNYASLIHWFLFDKEVSRDPIKLKPAIDAIPALAVGGVLSLAILAAEQYQLLFGMWMCLYGLAQVAYRRSLPGGIYMVGIFYILAGVICLLWGGVRFVNPWPMALVFLAGELVGGSILIMNNEMAAHARSNEEEDWSKE